MGDRYVNLGAPIRRDGKVVARRGEEFEPTEEEVVRKAYKLRRVVESGRHKYEPDSSTPEPAAAEELAVDDYKVGGGWYLIGGEKVQGRDAAKGALRALED